MLRTALIFLRRCLEELKKEREKGVAGEIFLNRMLEKGEVLLLPARSMHAAERGGEDSYWSRFCLVFVHWHAQRGLET